MGRTFRIIAGVIFVLIIAFSLISISQNVGKGWKVDVTGQRIYTLSNGTKAIVAKLNQPITMKLYYARTAALKGPDQIRYFNNYYEFVKSLLEEYVAVSGGMIKLEIIDPRPYSDDEVAALRYGIKRFPITEEENFFFGLVVQTQFGVEKVIPVFAPARQNFVEYDISYLIDTAITRQKKKIGIISSLPMVGDDISPYMMKMMQMQGQQPRRPWSFVEQLRQQYEVKNIPTDVNKIEGIDILLVVHPKGFSEQTLFVIDQFVVGGGKTIVFVDPYCVVDLPQQSPARMQTEHDPSSEMNKLLVNWGLEMPKDTFAGDRALAHQAELREGQGLQKIIGFLDLTPECFNRDNVITSQLNDVRVLFSGVLREVAMDDNEIKARNIQRTPLVMTTTKGNSWTVDNQYELMAFDADRLMKRFTDGTEPVKMAYLVTGRFKSAFPKGIDVEAYAPPDANEPNAPPKKIKEHIAGLAEAKKDCAVVVFADVDFICDAIAYNKNMFFGTIIVGDNSALAINAADDLSGSSELISIRSRGNFRRPFEVVDKIEAQAEAETAEQEAKINAEITGFENELQSILSSAKQGEEEIIGSSILQKKNEIELKIRQAKKELQQIKKTRLHRIENLGNGLRNFNMLTAPAVILVIAIILGARRSVRKRRYISHASDA
ncbi:MAG: Gldg family protein [Phycisphaerae bacterium]|nr:Gldg family protein [Phycisphaerae bacterium]